MSKKPIQTDNAPEAIGPYSQAIVTSGSGALVFVSGQIPLNPKTGEVVGGSIEEETRQVLENLKGILNASGATLDDVVRTTIFLKDMNDFQSVNEVYGGFFSRPYPARACVEVARLPKNINVEIDAIAKVQN